jgi:sodium pump decarboxylase gamma subunit
MQKAGLNTLMGISVVFCILVLISLIIYCFNLIPVLQKKFSKKQDDEARPVKTPAPVAAPVAKQQDDLELIAVIAAAIAMETGASTDDFVVRSIKRRY